MKSFIYALSLSLVATTPALAVTAISGGVAAGTNVQVGDVSDTDSSSTSVAGVPGPIGALSQSSVVVQDFTTYVFSSVSATWASANAGLIDFNWGWEAPGPLGVPTLVETNKVPEGWSYSFTTGASGARFNLNWDAAVSGASTFGLQGLYGTGGLPFYVTTNATAPENGTGSFFVDLAANTTYNLGIYNFGNLSSDGGLNSTTSSRVLINWNIVDGAVPEPATWMMMLMGFGLIGGMMRSRRLRGSLAFA